METKSPLMILAGTLSHWALFWMQTVYQHQTFRKRSEAERKQPWSASRELLWVDPDAASAKCGNYFYSFPTPWPLSPYCPFPPCTSNLFFSQITLLISHPESPQTLPLYLNSTLMLQFWGEVEWYRQEDEAGGRKEKVVKEWWVMVREEKRREHEKHSQKGIGEEGWETVEFKKVQLIRSVYCCQPQWV